MKNKIDIFEGITSLMSVLTLIFVILTAGGLDLSDHLPLYVYIVDGILVTLTIISYKYTALLKDREELAHDLKDQYDETTAYIEKKYDELNK